MTKRQEQRQATEAKVIAAAEHLFSTRGFKPTTIRDIAAEAGVSAGSVMAVGDKAALLVSMFDRGIARIHAERAEPGALAITSQTSGDPVERMLALVAPFLTIFAEHSELSRDYAAILVGGSHGSTVFGPLAEALVGEMRQVLLDSGLDQDAAGVAARACYLAYLGVLFSWAGGGGSDHVEALADFRSVLAFITQSKGETP